MTTELTPNRPLDRLRYVVETYMGTKNQQILPDVVKISFMLLGLDGHASAAARQPWVFRADHPSNDRLLADLVPENHPHDFLIPWVAKELGRLRKAVLKNEATGEDYAHAATELEKKGPVIAMWAAENRVNLTKTSLAEALEAVKDFEVDAGNDVAQGKVVYEFADGYTIQRLTEEAELEAEGEIMQHCVGGYCAQVAEGATVIFSLRDSHGRPHATIEWVPNGGKVGLANTLLFWRDGEYAAPGRFAQIRGKQNEIPATKYRVYVQEFIRERFGGDPLGLLMVALPNQTIVFAGHEINEVDFVDDTTWSGTSLQQADFRGATFNRVIFDKMNDVKFDGSTFRHGCQFGGLHHCSFRDAVFGAEEGTELSTSFGGRVEACDFRMATFLSEAHFSRSERVEETDFRGSRWARRAGAYDTVFAHCDFSEAVWNDVDFSQVAFRSCEMATLTIAKSAKIRDIALIDTDLRQMDTASAERLWDGLETALRAEFRAELHAASYGGLRKEVRVQWPPTLQDATIRAGRQLSEFVDEAYGGPDYSYDESAGDSYADADADYDED